MFYIDEDTCTQCGSCLDACPCDAIIVDEKGHHSIDEALCIECGACYDVCEYGSIFEAEPATMIPKRDVQKKTNLTKL